MTNQAPALAQLDLQIELNGIVPDPVQEQLVQEYANQLCGDLGLPVSATVSIKAAASSPLPGTGLFRIALKGRALRNRCWPAPDLPEQPEPEDIAALVAFALYERREFFITSEVLQHLKSEWDAKLWPREAFAELLRHFARFNFKVNRAKPYVTSNSPLPDLARCFEHAVHSFIFAEPDSFGVCLSGGQSDLGGSIEKVANDLGILLPPLRPLNQPPNGAIESKINDVRLPQVRTLPPGTVLLTSDAPGLNSSDFFDPFSGERYRLAAKSAAEARNVPSGYDATSFAGDFLKRIILADADSLLAPPLVQWMLEQTWLKSNYLVSSVEQKFAPLGKTHIWLAAVLRRLLGELVPVRDLSRVLENLLALLEVAPAGQKEVQYFSERPDCPLRIASGPLPELTTEHLVVAARLGAHPLSENIAGQGSVPLLRLPPQLENSLAALSCGPVSLPLADELVGILKLQRSNRLALVVAQENRAAVSRSLQFEFPTLLVLGRAEVPSHHFAIASANASRALFQQHLGKREHAIGLAVEAVREDPLAPALHENLGRLQVSAGQPEKAHEQFEAALALTRKPQQLLTLADDDFQKRNYEDAVRLCRAVARKFHGAESDALLGQRLYNIGAWRRSICAYKAALLLDPGNHGYRASLAAALVSQGDYLSPQDLRRRCYEDAISAFNGAIARDAKTAWYFALRSAARSKLSRLDEHTDSSNRLLDQAEADLRQAAVEPQSKRAISLELARFLAQRGKFNDAVTQLNPFLTGQPSDFEIHVELARIFAQDSDFEQACSHADLASKAFDKLPPEIQETFKIMREGLAVTQKSNGQTLTAPDEAILGSVQSRLKNLDAALLHYRKAAELEPSARLHKELGNILYKQNAYQAAVEEWLQAGDDPLTMNNLGTAYDGLNKAEQASVYYDKAIRIAPGENKFVPLFNLGTLHYRRQEWESSLSFYTRALELKPAFALAYLRRADASFHLNKLDDAESDWRNAIGIDRQLCDAWHNLGVALWKSPNNRQESAECWKEAWMLDRNFTLAEDNLLAARASAEPSLRIVDLLEPRNALD